jgi:hypothetical protein
MCKKRRKERNESQRIPRQMMEDEDSLLMGVSLWSVTLGRWQRNVATFEILVETVSTHILFLVLNM